MCQHYSKSKAGRFFRHGVYDCPAKYILRKCCSLNSIFYLNIQRPLQQLHWIPVKWRIRYKLATATLTHKTLSSATPSYLSYLLSLYAPSWLLRSNSANLLTVPPTMLAFSSYIFHVSAPTVWNCRFPTQDNTTCEL